MRTRFAVVATIVGLAAGAAAAQAPKPPQPGAQHKRIDYFAGKWTLSGEAKASPMGPAGKMSGTEDCAWFAGNFFLVCHSSVTGPLGALKGQSIMGYDPAENTYTFYAFNNIGMGFFVRGQVAGKVWTWNFDTKMEGKSMKGRFTVTEETPTSYAFKMEASVDGGPTSLVEEGKATKSK